MADLLSQPTRDALRSIIGDVLDTFAKTPVIYRKLGAPANDYMEELDRGTYTDYELMAVLEFTDDIKDKVDYEPFTGLADKSEVRLTFKLEDLSDLGLIDGTTHYPLFMPELDIMFVNDTEYKVVYVATDGHFEQKGLLVYAWGIKKELK